MHGPNPKPPSKRRRATPPVSYGAATPTTAPAAATQGRTLGLEPPVHSLVDRMWAALGESCEARFYSEADWERARWELWFANAALTSGRPINAAVWGAIQDGLSALLVSPADKRRAGIELKAAVDADEDAAVSIMARYRDKVK